MRGRRSWRVLIGQGAPAPTAAQRGGEGARAPAAARRGATQAPPLPALETRELTLIPAAPESRLADGVAARLPATAPPAPWRLTGDCVTWLQRAGPGAGAVLPAPLRPSRATAPDWVVGAFAAYACSPVGAYSEVFAGVVRWFSLRPVVHVPLMAVDSLASVRGGRANWSLPKTLAAFAGSPRGSGHLRAAGEGWGVRASMRTFGPLLPLRLRLAIAQARPDGTVGGCRVALRGRAGLASVDVDVTPGASLSAWMPPGRHVALQWRDAIMDVEPLTPLQAGRRRNRRGARPRPP